jgi:hypothetical protein
MMATLLGPVNAIVSLVLVIVLFIGCIILTQRIDGKKIRFKKGGR